VLYEKQSRHHRDPEIRPCVHLRTVFCLNQGIQSKFRPTKDRLHDVRRVVSER